MPKHYRSPSQTKTFFSTLSERTLCCCCLLPKFLNEGRGLVESAFFFYSSSSIFHALISAICFHIVNLIWIWFILQRHLRQDSGIGRLRLRQILLLRSTEYVFRIHYSEASCMPPLEFHGACPFYLVLLSRFNETQFKGKWGSHINVLVCLFLGKP